jgi:putative hydrolase of the HAD superfamily
MPTAIRALFLDVGGVMLTNGWDSGVRRATAQHFKLDFEELQSRHHLTFDTYEVGKITFDTFLDRTVFYQPREFTRDEFKRFVYEQAKPLLGMIELFTRLKAKHGLKIAVVSNEGRELMCDRVARFNLKSFVDFFIVSSFVHLRKPDTDIYNLALDVAMLEAPQVAYIDDRAMLVEVASALGIVGIQHTNYETTVSKLAALGLTL